MDPPFVVEAYLIGSRILNQASEMLGNEWSRRENTISRACVKLEKSTCHAGVYFDPRSARLNSGTFLEVEDGAVRIR